VSKEFSTVKEIFLNDPNAVFEDAPSSIALEAYKGPSGERGTYVIPGLGNPRTYNFSNSFILDNEGIPQTILPQPFDWFVNLSPTDPTYLTVFQLKSDNKTWDVIFKIIPNTYSQNTVSTFVLGQTEVNFIVPRESLRLEQLFGTGGRNSLSTYRIPDDEDTVTAVSSESEMLALSDAEPYDYAYRSDRSQFFRLVEEPASILENWQQELSINISLDIEVLPPGQPAPASLGFLLDAPSSDEDYYYFTLNISAAQLSITGLQPVAGERVIHTTISVI
jgi:hypothetical protein